MADRASGDRSDPDELARVWENDLVAVATDPAPWYATPAPTAQQHRDALQQQRSRLLARSVGGHLPYELAVRVAQLDSELADGQ